MNIHRFFTLCVLLWSAIGTTGCIKEQATDCPGLAVRFRYTLNNHDTDLIASKVQHVRLYVFDSREVLFDVVTVDHTELQAAEGKSIQLSAGRYHLIAWGGCTDNVLNNGYREAHMIDPAAHHYLRAVKIGETTLEKFRMMVDYQLLDEQVEGEITPTLDEFGDLFYGALLDFDYTPTTRQIETIELIKNTNTLHVVVNGVEHLIAARSQAPFHLFALGYNGRYTWDNAIGEHARMVRYEPIDVQRDGQSIEAYFKIQRMDLDRHTDLTSSRVDPIWLKLQEPATGADLIAPIDVLNSILQVRGANDALRYQTQDDIDRQDEYKIQLDIAADLSVRVTIDNWTIGSLDPELD